MTESIRNKFPGMIELSEAVHKAIITGNLNSKLYDNIDLDGMIRWHREANPLDFLQFRAWALTYEKKGEEEINKKYKEIVNKVLAARGSLLVCFKELLLFSQSYVIDVAFNGCYNHNRYLFGDDYDPDSDSDSD